MWLTFTAILVVLTTLFGEYVCVKFENKAVFTFGGMLDTTRIEDDKGSKRSGELSNLV